MKKDEGKGIAKGKSGGRGKRSKEDVVLIRGK